MVGFIRHPADAPVVKSPLPKGDPPLRILQQTPPKEKEK